MSSRAISASTLTAQALGQGLLVIDPAHEGKGGTAEQIAGLYPQCDICSALNFETNDKRLKRYFATLVILTSRTLITERLHRQLTDLSQQLRIIALIERSGKSRSCVSKLLSTGCLYDFHSLPIDEVRLRYAIGHLRGLAQLSISQNQGKDRKKGPHAMIGMSPAIKAVRKRIKQYALTDLPVLVSGESGTGKELAARAIHEYSGRANSVFLAINCATIPQSLAAAELFGHEKGAFTDASHARAGRFEQASGGTLFLDEIADLPLDVQAQLLRVLEDGQLYRIGGHEPHQANVRIIAASNADLNAAVKKGKFRFDLYHRLNVLPLTIPPLKDRERDAVILARCFVKSFAQDCGLPHAWLSEDAENAILAHNWQGNVRQLQNAIRRAITLNGEGEIRPRHLGLSRPENRRGPLPSLADARANLERTLVLKAIRIYGGNVSRAASELGVSRVGLYRLMKRHELDHRGLLKGEKTREFTEDI